LSGQARRKTLIASILKSLYSGKMVTVKLSSKFQVVIPRAVRSRLGLRPGMKLQVVEYDGRVEFIPVRKPPELRGFLGQIDTSIEREDDRL
jgi:AbrB family looped-hinge helix DNA binding protein